MATVTVPARQAAGAAREMILERLQRADLSQVLVANAKRRIANGGDSTHRYPDLWASTSGVGSYREGGQPLRDNGTLVNGLSGQSEKRQASVRITLRDGSPGGYGVYHQTGFTTKGPNFIPLTLKARRTHVKGNDPTREGLIFGVDYIMAWKGVTVPQRKIHNNPPEDLADLREAIASALGGGR